MKTIVIALIAGLLLTGCGSENKSEAKASSTPTDEALRSLVFVGIPHPSALASSSESCSAGPKYADVDDGAQVTIENADGTVVATGALKLNQAIVGEYCIWSANIDDVPAGGDFYTARVGQFTSDAVPESEIAKFTIEPADGDSPF